MKLGLLSFEGLRSPGAHALSSFAIRSHLEGHEVYDFTPGGYVPVDLLLVPGESLIDGRGTVVRRFASFYEFGPLPAVLPLGVRIPFDEQGRETLHDEEVAFLESIRRRLGKISAGDPLSARALARRFGESSVVFTGGALAASKVNGVTGGGRVVLCPSAIKKNESRALRDLGRQTWGRDGLIILALEQEDLEGESEPGLHALHSRHPEVVGEALGGRSRIVSLRLEPALVGASLGSKAVAADLNPADGALASWVGIPQFRLRETSTAEIDHLFQTYPSEAIGERLEELRERVWDYLGGQGIRRHVGISHAGAKSLGVCCLSDEAYLPHLIGLIENLRRVHDGPLRLFILALDDVTRTFVESELGDLCRVFTLRELWPEPDLRMILSRPVAERAYRSKPRFLERALAQWDQSPLLYCDVDLHFLRSPFSLGSHLGEGSALLFPHWNDRLELLKLHGIFNAGLLVVRKGAEPFLRWWTEMCLSFYNTDKYRGYWNEQGALDLAPALFDFVRVYRRGDQNVAHWNVETLGSKGVSHFGSIHAAGPDALGMFEIKCAWDQVATLRSSLNRPHRFVGLVKNVYLQQKDHWPAARRAYYLHYFLGKLSFGRERLAPRWLLRLLCVERGRLALDGLVWLYLLYRKLCLRLGGLGAQKSRWIALQRELISS